jgi:hypothetical protein
MAKAVTEEIKQFTNGKNKNTVYSHSGNKLFPRGEQTLPKVGTNSSQGGNKTV